MAKQIKRVYRNRKLTPEEAARYAEIRRRVQEEFPPKKRAKSETVELSNIMVALKDARTAQGLTLAEMTERTGIEPPNLSTLENAPDANPTLNTLVRYAGALGKKVRVLLEDS